MLSDTPEFSISHTACDTHSVRVDCGFALQDSTRSSWYQLCASATVQDIPTRGDLTGVVKQLVRLTRNAESGITAISVGVNHLDVSHDADITPESVAELVRKAITATGKPYQEIDLDLNADDPVFDVDTLLAQVG
jgi:hypothetical protein